MHGPSNDIPSATDLLEVLLGSPTEFELTDEELSGLRGIRLDLQWALIDISSSIRKAGLSREENADAAQGADAVIADLIEAAAAARVTANAALRRVLGPGKYRRAVGVFGRQGKEAAVATSVAGEHPEPAPVRAELAILGLSQMMKVTYGKSPRIAAMVRTSRGVATL